MIDHKTKEINPKTISKMNSEVKATSEDQIQDKKFSMRLSHKKRKITIDESVPKKKEKIDLYKQPTVEELNQLRETENLFHSNLFRLQIEEVLTAVKIHNKYKKLFEIWLEKFKCCLKEIEDTKEYELNNDLLFQSCNIKIPIQKLPNECTGIFKFLPPSNIAVGGSYSLETAIGPDASIDILLEMPKNLFKNEDSRNYRYMRKKAIYLAYIGSKIDNELVEQMSFIGHSSNPILKIVPSGKLNKRIVLHIHAVLQETIFLLKKFTPEKNNVKSSWYFKKSNVENTIGSPTPYYNNIVLRDLTVIKTNAENLKLIEQYPNIRDGIILLKIWLKQREVSTNFESFNGHIITMYVLYLLRLRKLNKFMSSYQIVRNTWQCLATSNWCKEGISLSKEDKIQERIALYHKYYDCVFLNYNGYHNLAANILQDTFQLVSNQASMAIDCLNNTRFNNFQILFMRKVPLYKAFDFIICLHNIKAVENVIKAVSKEDDDLNYGSSKYLQTVKLTINYLKEGMGNRIGSISTLPRKVREWKMNDETPNDLERFYIGIQLNPNFAFNIIEKGPTANLAEAEEFRKFWKNKSDLRRFKDGTICEAIVWAHEKATLAQKRLIPTQITKFLLEEKLKLFENIHYFFFSNELESFLKPKQIQVTKFHYGMEEASLQVISIFDSLEKQLSGMTDLPLTINGVQGYSPLFRYADVFPPLALIRKPDDKNVVAGSTHLLFHESLDVQEVPFYLVPIEATLQLSMSGKWPEDLEALRMTKAAFNVQIAKCARKQYKLRAQASSDYIDIMKDGLVFRFRIAQQKEIGLLKQQKGEDGVIKYRDNEESLLLEETLFHLPRITGALYGLHCQHSSFGPACCLAKRWLSAQLIDNSHMPDICIELLMASIYLNTDPYKVPHFPQVAFLRFLEFLSREDWSTDPIIVNFNNEMTREQVIEVENMFGTSRDTLPPLFIATPYDKQTSMWTRKAPSPLILNRASSLSREVLKILEIQLFTNTVIHYLPLFKPPLSEYDCLIRLNGSLNPRRYEAVDFEHDLPALDPHPFKEHFLTKIPITGFNPVSKYLSELRSTYDDFALFFHDTYGGNVIGVLLRPQVYEEKDFKVGNIKCQKFNDHKKLILNVSAMIEDFYILGKGLVKTIDIQSKKINIV